MSNKKTSTAKSLPGGLCPKCEQPGYEPGVPFHFSDDYRKQCLVCGHDLVDSCPSCLRPGWKGYSNRYIPGVECSSCGRGWISNNSFCAICKLMFAGNTHCPICKSKLSEPPNAESQKTIAFSTEEQTGTAYMTQKNKIYSFWCNVCKADKWSDSAGGGTCPDCHVHLNTATSFDNPKEALKVAKAREEAKGVKKEKKEKVEKVSAKDWARFQRFQDSFKELEELAAEVKSNWRDHLKYLQEEYSMFDREIDGLDEPIGKIPRLLKFILSGYLPPATIDDEDLDYYDEQCFNHYSAAHDRSFGPIRPMKQIVEVHIQDISTGDL
jgi:hypothetical protein